VACAPDKVEPDAHPADERPTAVAAAPDLTIEATAADSAIFHDRFRRAVAEGWHTLPIGQTVARLAETFVGAPYVPGTLDAPGDERVIVNLRDFDCVTLVESVLAMARVIRAGDDDFGAFARELARIRYRDGTPVSYIARLHYFSEWISDNEAKGIVRNTTAELGGVIDPEPIDFMSRNIDAYRQLGVATNVAAIREIEQRLSAQPRHYIPQNAIAQAAPGIQDGDVIAATSSVRGLDIAHTGFALWRNGQLHLLHAPLVGSVVEISVQPLPVRIQRIGTQDGIMVARPQ
jgi:hypothetical protein